MTDRPTATAPSPAGCRSAERLHLSPRHRAKLEALLREHLPDVEVWAYGSRITGESHDGSDLDLVLRAPDLQEIPIGRLSDLWEALRESTIPFLVEARDWARLPEGFHGEIERDYVVLVKKTLTSGRLADYVVITMGQSPHGEAVVKRSVAEVPPGVPLLNGPTEFGPHHPKPVQFTTTVHRLAHPGDILFCVRGSTGRMNWADQKYAIGRGLAAIRHRTDKALQPFIRAVVEHGIPDLLTVATGSVFTNVSASQLGSLPYPNLTETEQRAVAHVLGALDDKIELNRRMNETLEAMARALFKSWFVDFDPVRAKMEGSDTGLPADVADLFPSRLVDSEFGKVPVGWESVRLDSVANTTKGRSYRRAELATSDTALVTLKSFVRGGGYRPEGLKPFRGAYKSEQVLQPGDVIVACTDVTQLAEVVGRSAIVEPTSSFQTLVASLDVLIMRPKNASAGRFFLYYLTKTPGFVTHVVARTTGTTVLHLSKDAVASFEFALPPQSLVERFEQWVDSLRARIHVNASTVASLTDLRAALLPSLVSGELPVPLAVRQRGEQDDG